MDATCHYCDAEAVTEDMVTGKPLCEDHAQGANLLL